MTFNAFPFYLFFILVVVVNYLLPKRWRWVWLLLSSYVFYGLSDLRFLLVLITCTAVSYATGILISRNSEERRKKAWLISGLIITVGMLAVFKYMNFILEAINTLASMIGVGWTFRGIDLLYPIGISFYTFQMVSYMLDVTSGKITAENNFLEYALFISFFPQLLNGPIERYGQLGKQFKNPLAFDSKRVTDSLVRIGWGLFKKFVIADRLAIATNTVFADIGAFGSPKLIAGVLAFTFQIYLDFSAYSDIAIGTASILGIELAENFDRPYFATSVIDFWRRWHISLSSWLRDYIFLKLNYKHRRRKPRNVWTALDVLSTFLISGLWHGANWTFIVWGLLHGLYQAVELLTQKAWDRIARERDIKRDAPFNQTLQIAFTFCLVSFTWIFFKAETIGQALQMIGSIFSFDGLFSREAWRFGDGTLGLDQQDMGMMAATLAMFLAVELAQRKYNLLEILNKQPTWVRFMIYYALFFSITIFGYYGEASVVDFVYFQF